MPEWRLYGKQEDAMFDFLRQKPAVEDQDTGTFADGVVIHPEISTATFTRRERGHVAHTRDYSDNRTVHTSAVGFA